MYRLLSNCFRRRRRSPADVLARVSQSAGKLVGRRGAAVEPLEGRRLFAGFAAAVDFMPDGATTTLGYVGDAGLVYGVRSDGLTFGWDADVSARAKTKASAAAPDERYETFIAPKKAIWEMAVPSGVYSVHIVAGDGATGVKAKVDVEGIPAVYGKTSKDARWLEATLNVTVSDGRLTVSPGENFKSNKLAFLEATLIGVQATAEAVTPVVTDPVVTDPASGTPATTEPTAPTDPTTPATPTDGGIGLSEPAAPTAPVIVPVGPPAIAWSAGTTTAPQTRVEAGVARLGTKLYVMGGYVHGFDVDNTTDVFDAATGTWSKGPDFPGSQTHASVATDGVRFIYKVAGQVGGSVPGTPTNEAWQLDTVTNQWSPLPALPEVRYAAGMAYVDGKLYLFAGDAADRTTTTTTHWSLDLSNLSAGWVAKAPIPEAGDHIATEVVGGLIYAVGGEHGHAAQLPEGNAPYIQHNYLFRYDPAADAWTRLADLPVAHSHAEGTTLVVNGKILTMGGKLSPTEVSNSVELYDPADNTWTSVGTLPQDNQGGAAIFYDGKLYLTYGQEGAPSHTMWNNLWVGLLTGM